MGKRKRLKEGQRSLIDRDKLNNASQAKVAAATVEVFASLQKKPREIQLLALAAAFVLQAEALRISTNDTYAAVINLMKDPLNASGRKAQFDAMKFHLETELDERSTRYDPADGK